MEVVFMKKKSITIFLTFLFVNLITFSQEVKVTRITDKVIVLNVTKVSNCNIVAVSSDEGIILVDTEISPLTMEMVKDAIENEFPGKKFIYIINTHAHAHHCDGNSLFKGLPIIAHENIIEDIQWWFDIFSDEKVKQDFMDFFEKNIAECEASMEGNSDISELESLKELIKYWEKRAAEIENGFEVVIPNIRFTDRMKLQLKDMTLDLIYYGKGHSKSDILIHIPEEKVLISGAAFFPGIPSAHAKRESERDITRLIYVLKILKDTLNSIETVIPAHTGLRDNQVVKLHYDYFSEMYEKTQDLKKKGLSFDTVKESLSLDKGFSHYTQFKDLSDNQKERHIKNLKIFWNKTELSP
jgi:cyclase